MAACADPAAPGTDVTIGITWMEWPGAVTESQPGSIRVTGFHGLCGTFRISAAQSGPSTISVDAVVHFDAAPQACPGAIVLFDTMLPLPRLTLPPGGNNAFVVDAPIFDQAGVVFRRPFGYLALSSNQPDATLHAGGKAFVLPDSLGCSWARAQMPPAEQAHVLSSDITLGTNDWHTAFVSGVFAPALSPRCGQDPLFQLTVLEVSP